MKITLLIYILLLVSCNKQTIKIEETDNENFDVETLFEYEGIKMYRFYDGGRYHYFASKGQTITTHSQVNRYGKTDVIHGYDENLD